MVAITGGFAVFGIVNFVQCLVISYGVRVFISLVLLINVNYSYFVRENHVQYTSYPYHY